MKLLRLFSMLTIAVLVVGLLGTTASAQKFTWTVKGSKTPIPLTGIAFTDLLKVNYFSNANSSGPDGTVRITNPGSGAGDLCAQIYVFDPLQEMAECCACLVTPDGLRTLSVNTDLTSNTLTSTTLHMGSVSIVSGIVPSSGVCSPLNYYVYPTIRAWGTHIQDLPTYTITETEYSDRALGPWNANLLIDCYAIALDGSGHGTCSCGSGD